MTLPIIIRVGVRILVVRQLEFPPAPILKSVTNFLNSSDSRSSFHKILCLGIESCLDICY